MALKTRYRRLLYVLVGIAAFLVLLPEIIRVGARYALTEVSAQSVEIEDVDLNLFTGRAGVTGLRIDYADETTLSLGEFRVDLDMSALFGKQLLVEQLEVSDVSAKVYEKDGQWVAVLPIPAPEAPADEPEPDVTSDSDPWKVGISALALKDIDLAARYQGQQHQLRLDQVTAADLFMWKPDTRASLMLKGAINGAPLNFDSGLKPFAEPRAFSLDIAIDGLNLDPVNQFLPDTVEHIAATLDLDTEVSLQLQPNGDISISQDGTIALALDQARASGLDAGIETISWKGAVKVNFPKEGNAAINAQGEALVRGLKANYSKLDADAQLGSLLWTGDVTVDIPPESQPVLALQGGLVLDQLVASQATIALSQRLAGLEWNGNVGVNLEALESSLKVQGDLNLSEWQVDDRQQDGRLAAFDTLTLSGIQIQGLDDMVLKQFGITSVSAMDAPGTDSETDDEQTDYAGLLALGGLAINDIDMENRKNVNVTSVNLNDLRGELTKTPEGKIKILDDWVSDLQERIAALQDKLTEQQKSSVSDENAETPDNSSKAAGDETETRVASTKKEEAFRFAVGAISVTGENRFTFHDLSVEPNVIHPIQIKKFEIGKIDSADTASLTPVDVEMALYEYAVLKVSGQATPLQPLDAFQADLSADVKGVELPELSPYIENTTGYHANSGQLNLDASANIKAGKLDSKTEVKILRIDLKPVDQALIDKLGKKLTMPVNTALSVITDSDNTLALTVPIKGDLAKPDIQLDRIVGGAVTQAVQNAALTYFKYAVQPFGAIMMVSEKIGDMTLQARFEPARFVPGSAEIVSEQSGYLKKVAGMIKEKEGFSILVCVMVTPQDFKARETPPVLAEGESYEWDEPSEALAKSRLGAIKNSLIKEHGLSPDRVQTCRPQLGEGEPRAIMGI